MIELSGRETIEQDNTISFEDDEYTIFGTKFLLSDAENDKDCQWDGNDIETNFIVIPTKHGDITFAWYVTYDSTELEFSMETANDGEIKVNRVIGGTSDENSNDLRLLIESFEKEFYETQKKIVDEPHEFRLYMDLTCTYKEMLAIREHLNKELDDMCESFEFKVKKIKRGRNDCIAYENNLSYEENKRLVERSE